MPKRIINKSHSTFKKYGFKETAKRTLTFFERKVRPTKYYHYDTNSPKSEKGNVLFVSGEPKNATSYYRCEIPKFQLEQLGWGVDIVHESFAGQVDANKYSLIIFYRTPLDECRSLLDKARKAQIKFLFSIDDLLYRRELLEKLDYTSYLQKEDAERLLSRADGMLNLMKEVDGGIASTEYIAKDMKNYIKGKILVSRNGILDEYTKLVEENNMEKETGNKIHIGYFSGSETHDRDLDLVWPALQRVLGKYPNVELHVGGRIHFHFDNYVSQIKKMPFMPRAEFMKTLSQIDINLLPLEDTQFNRGKSEIKFIEAGLVEVPTIASKVGDLGLVIDESVGMLCTNEEQWYTKMSELIKNTTTRRNMGKAARQFILKNYNSEKLGKELEKHLFMFIK